MICAIQSQKGEFIFLDRTDPTCVFGIPSPHIQAKQPLRALEDAQYPIARVASPPEDTNQLVDSCLPHLTETGITGRVNIHLSGYYPMNAHAMLNYINGKDKDKYMRARFSRGSNKFQLTS